MGEIYMIVLTLKKGFSLGPLQHLHLEHLDFNSENWNDDLRDLQLLTGRGALTLIQWTKNKGYIVRVKPNVKKHQIVVEMSSMSACMIACPLRRRWGDNEAETRLWFHHRWIRYFSPQQSIFYWHIIGLALSSKHIFMTKLDKPKALQM
jgi:hypothetical protein